MYYIYLVTILPNLFPINSILTFEVEVEVISAVGTDPKFIPRWVGRYISNSGLDYINLDQSEYMVLQSNDSANSRSLLNKLGYSMIFGLNMVITFQAKSKNHS